MLKNYLKMIVSTFIKNLNYYKLKTLCLIFIFINYIFFKFINLKIFIHDSQTRHTFSFNPNLGQFLFGNLSDSDSKKALVNSVLQNRPTIWFPRVLASIPP